MAGLLEGATGVLVDGKWRAGGAAAQVRGKFALVAALVDGAVRVDVRVRARARLVAVSLGADGAVARAAVEHAGGTEHIAAPGRDSGGCPNDPAYMIFDSLFLRRYPLPGVSPGTKVPGWVASAPTPAEQASQIGVDPDGLERTVARWNTACAEGSPAPSEPRAARSPTSTG